MGSLNQDGGWAPPALHRRSGGVWLRGLVGTLAALSVALGQPAPAGGGPQSSPATTPDHTLITLDPGERGETPIGTPGDPPGWSTAPAELVPPPPDPVPAPDGPSLDAPVAPATSAGAGGRAPLTRTG